MSYFFICANDTNPTITTSLTNSSGYMNLSGSTIHFFWKFKGNLTSGLNSGVGKGIGNLGTGLAEYTFTTSNTLNAGVYKGKWKVIYPSGSTETYPKDGYIDFEINNTW